jgi:hypothetical protein
MPTIYEVIDAFYQFGWDFEDTAEFIKEHNVSVG